MKYPIGTPFIHIVNPLDPDRTTYFGLTVSEEFFQKDIKNYCYEVEFIATNSIYTNLMVLPKEAKTYMKEELMVRAVKNYEDYIKTIENERTTTSR